MTKNKKRLFAFYAVFFVLFAVIMYLSPHTVDDAYYDYLNITNPYKILHFAAGYGNGRVLGNLLAVVLCKSQILAAVVRSAVVGALVYFIVKLTNGEKEHTEVVTASVMLLMLGVGGLFFSEVFAWISGFSNYIPPMLLTLVCLCLIKERDSKTTSFFAKILTVTELLVFASAAQLFTENNTLNSALLAVLVFAYCLIKDRSKLLYSVAYLIGSGIGALVMIYARFYVYDASGIYGTVNYGARIDSLDGLLTNIGDIYGKFVCWLPKFFLLYIMLSAVLLLLIYKGKKYLSNKLRAFVTFSLCAYPAYSVVSSVLDNGNFANAKMQYLYTALTTVLFVLYVISLFICGSLFETKQAVLFDFIVAFALFTSSYFVVLNPVTPRCIFYSYVAFAVAFCVALNNTLPYIELKEKAILGIFKASVIGVFAFLIPLYANITVMNNQVNDYVKYQVEQGQKAVNICLLTNTDYFHHSYAKDRLGYAYYIQKPHDVEFRLIGQDSWLNNYYQDGNYKNSATK